MADLDDFFKKKDKKKGGKKKGFSKANTDVLAKNLEEKELRDLKAEERSTSLATSEATRQAFEDNPVAGVHGPGTVSNGAKPNTTSATEGGEESSSGPRTSTKYFGVINESNDDDWMDYENEKKDYSGLKIESLKLDKEGEGGGEEEHQINEETGEKIIVSKKDGNVWKRNNQQQKRSGSPDEEEEEEKSEDGDNASSGGGAGPPAGESANAEPAAGPPKSSYVPPHLRGMNRESRDDRMSGGTGASGPSLAPMRLGGGGGGGRRMRAAPDINNEMYFPSLSAAGSGGKPEKGGHEFEQVRSGGSASKSSAGPGGAPRLALGNKYDALRD